MRVAVVVALYQQAQFLVESVSSALTQSLPDVGVVIVNDGCPDPASHQLGTAFAAAYPERVVYVRQRNGGLSAARNCGIRRALDHWPEVEAVFFLDADNVLQPQTLEMMYTRLNCDDGIGWVYAVLERFGVDCAPWYSDTPANLFRMLFENQCDAGSLVRRTIFDAGLFFDETLRDGYEDWEFFLRALRHGYRGESAGYCGFLYRVKHRSMVTESQAKHDAVVAMVHDRHRDLLEPRRLTAIEHQHAPRFFWTGPHGEPTRIFTDPFAAAAPAQDGYLPPLLLIGAPGIWQLLADAKMLRGLLLIAQASAPSSVVAFRIEIDDTKWEISQSRQGAPHALCFYSGRLESNSARSPGGLARAASSLLGAARQYLVRVPKTLTLRAPKPLDRAGVSVALGRAEQHGLFDPLPGKTRPDEKREWPTRHFAWERHCVQLDTTHPFIGGDGLRIAIAVPWLKLGGVDQCVIQLSRCLRRLVPSASLHLISTREGVECGTDNAEAFDEVVFLGGVENWDRQTRLCDSVLRSMDLVINAHSEVAYGSLQWRLQRPKQDRFDVHVSYLHVIDEAKGRLAGYPVLAVDMEHGFDGFAVISENLRNYLINAGVSPGKIRLVRNAPVVRPASIEQAMEIAGAKSRRLAAGGRPLRLLFAGRADYQKGISRLGRMIDILTARDVPFELTFVGGPNLAAEEVRFQTARVRAHPPTHDEAALARYYADADVCVLLSRWEGVPLSLLDAMAHGCVVVATDVGAVSELVEDGMTGFLVPNDHDEAVAPMAADIIEKILTDETGNLSIRREAVAAAFSYSWNATARAFLSFLPEALKKRHGLADI